MTGSAARVAQLNQAEEQRRVSREDLITVHFREEEVEIAAFDGALITLRSMTTRRRRELRDRAGFGSDEWDDDLFTALCVVECIVDPALTEADVQAIMDQDVGLWDELTLHVSLINMPSQRKTVKDLGKDSSPTENSDSA